MDWGNHILLVAIFEEKHIYTRGVVICVCEKRKIPCEGLVKMIH